MLVPASLAEHTVESLYAAHRRDRAWIYRLLLLGAFGALASLPLIKVDVSVRAPGMVCPASGRTELRVAVSGRIEQVLAGENESVEAGQALVVLASTDLDERLARQRARQAECAGVLHDLARLIRTTGVGETEASAEFLTAALRQEWVQYTVQRDAYRLAANKAQGELARYTTLSEKGIATRQEWENARYEAERLAMESRLLAEQARSRWQDRLKEEGSALADFDSAITRLEDERAQCTLRAPKSGVLLGLTGLNPGTYVAGGQVLGILSPADALLVETQVPSRDIAQVKLGQAARLQVDAYPYTEWGTLEGVVTAISGDWAGGADASGGPPVFKVLVRPSRLFLSLPGGMRGELKKGLTLSARFTVARRSLWQLLYDDAGAWLNPQDQRRT